MNETFDKILSNASMLFGKFLDSKKPVAAASAPVPSSSPASALPSWLLPVAAIGGVILVLVLVIKN